MEFTIKYNREEDIVKYHEDFGYEIDEVGDLVPTDLQIELQDDVDGTIQHAVNKIVGRYSEAADIGDIDLDHDISKLTEIREVIEKAYGLPEVY